MRGTIVYNHGQNNGKLVNGYERSGYQHPKKGTEDLRTTGKEAQHLQPLAERKKRRSGQAVTQGRTKIRSSGRTKEKRRWFGNKPFSGTKNLD